MNTNVVEQAIIFAAQRHGGAKRKGSDVPYIVHPVEACAIAARLTNDLNVIAAAALHDVVEDTSATEEELQNLFGETILNLVKADSEDKRREISASESWEDRKRETLMYLQTRASVQEKIVVLSDKLSNIRSIYNDYLNIGDDLWNRFNQKDKEKHAWYYKSFIDIFAPFQGTYVYDEYVSLVTKVFGQTH